MASNSSKAIPYLVLLIVVATISAEVYLDTEIDLESYLPLLIPLGIGGAVIKSVQVASRVKDGLDVTDLKSKVKAIVSSLKTNGDI